MFRIDGANSLETINLSQPIDIRGDLLITNSLLLSAVNGMAGFVGGKMVVTKNPALSTAAISAWPSTVVGTKTVSGNKFS